MRRPVLCSLALLAVARIASADVCDDLNIAIDAAPKQFASLKGQWDRDMEWYQSRWTILGAADEDCGVSLDEDNGNNLSCLIDTTESNSRADVESASKAIEACLKARGKYISEPWKDSSRDGRTASYTRRGRNFLVPTNSPAFDVSIDVSAGCTTYKRRGNTRCNVNVTVELKGDEK